MPFPTLTLANSTGGQASAPTFFDTVSFAGPASYPTGGIAGFATALQAKTKSGRDPLVVAAGDCGGYVPVYDKTNDKLKVYWLDPTAGAKGPLVEVDDTTNLGAVTFNLTIVSQ